MTDSLSPIDSRATASRRKALAAIAGLAVSALAPAALAQGAWPAKPVRIVVKST